MNKINLWVQSPLTHIGREEFRQRALRILVVAGILVICAYLVPRIPQSRLILVLIAVVGTGVALVLLQKPSLGPALLVLACLVGPFEIGTGTNSGLNAGILLLLLLLGLWLLNALARHQAMDIVRSKPILPVLLLIVAALMSFTIGQLPWFPVPAAPLPAQIGGLFIFLLSAGAFLLVAHQIQTLQWLQAMMWTFIAVGFIYILGNVTPGLDLLTGHIMQNGATGSLFWVWLITLPFSQALFNRQLPMPFRLALMGLVIGAFYVGFVQNYDWKSGWIPPLVGVATIIAVRWRKLTLITIALGVAPAVGIMAKVLATDEYSYLTRVAAWEVLLSIIKKSPILGLGPANYYWYTPLFPILGWRVQFNSHSQYVDLVLQTGIVGLFCFLWFAWEIGRLGLQLLRQVPEGFERAYVYGVLGGLVGTVVAGTLGDWVLPFVYNVGLSGMRASLLGWIFMGGLVALSRLTAVTPVAGRVAKAPSGKGASRGHFRHA